MKSAIIAAIAATTMLAGSAFAQTSGTAGGVSSQNGSGSNIMSDMEQSMMDENPGMMSFFTDDTRTELRSEDEFRASWDAMSDDDRTRLQGACDTPDMTESNFSRGTVSLCAQVKAANAG